MSASPSPSSVLAQCTICEWQGWIEPLRVYKLDTPWLEGHGAFEHCFQNSCTRCGAMKLIDRSTQAPSHA